MLKTTARSALNSPGLSFACTINRFAHPRRTARTHNLTSSASAHSLRCLRNAATRTPKISRVIPPPPPPPP